MATQVHSPHAPASRLEHSAQVLSCYLKFVHAQIDLLLCVNNKGVHHRVNLSFIWL